MKRLLLALIAALSFTAPAVANSNSVEVSGCILPSGITNEDFFDTTSITLPLNTSILDIGLLDDGDVIALEIPWVMTPDAISNKVGADCYEAIKNTPATWRITSTLGSGPLVFSYTNTDTWIIDIGGSRTLEDINRGSSTNTIFPRITAGTITSDFQEFNQLLTIQIEVLVDPANLSTGNNSFNLR